MQSAQFQLHADIEERHWWFVARRRITRRIVGELLPPSRETTILDVGCGTGANIGALAQDYRCIGIDTSAEAIDLARQRFPLAQFICGEAPRDVAEVMPQVRLILLMDVLEHLPDDEGMLAKLTAAAAPGTYFLITVPADRKLWSGHDVAFGHYRRYDAESLRRLWSNLPLSLAFMSSFNARLYPLIRMVRTVNRWRGKASGLSDTDFRMSIAPVNAALERLFAGEARRLIGALHGRRSGYRRGASLMAVLRREAT